VEVLKFNWAAVFHDLIAAGFFKGKKHSEQPLHDEKCGSPNGKPRSNYL